MGQPHGRRIHVLMLEGVTTPQRPTTAPPTDQRRMNPLDRYQQRYERHIEKKTRSGRSSSPTEG
jgi:hypothetical protein